MRAFMFVIGILLSSILISGCTRNAANPPGTNSTTIPPGYEVKDYCLSDGDCVRLDSCCDCGIGTYVNKYNQAPLCDGPRCMCAIRMSEGSCQKNKCVAVAVDTAPSQGPVLTFNSSHGECGDETIPTRKEMQNGIALNGSVGGGSACRTARAELVPVEGGYALNISTRAIPGIAACINCPGAIPWEADISGYSGPVQVFYDGRTVFPARGDFCGNSTNAPCTVDSDCTSGGCSGQVCQSVNEEPAITTCEYRDCYDSKAYSLDCVCALGKCQWH